MTITYMTQMTADLPGGLREHGASRHAGRDAPLPGTTQTPTASRNMARDNLRWASRASALVSGH